LHYVEIIFHLILMCFFFELIVTINSGELLFQLISSISYGFCFKLDCSKSGGGGRPCRLAAVISLCT